MNQLERLDKAFKRLTLSVTIESQGGKFFIVISQLTSEGEVFTGGKYYDTIEAGIKDCLDYIDDRNRRLKIKF